VRNTLPRLIALSAVLVLPLSCGRAEPAAPSQTPAAVKATPSSTPPPAALTKATFAPRVLGALKAKGTFRVHGELITQIPSIVVIDASVRLKGGQTDLAVSHDGDQLVRIGSSIYVKDAELTSNKARPWGRLDLRSSNPELGFAAALANDLVSDALFHELIGGAAYATSFKRGGQPTVGLVETQEYLLVIDLKKATAAKALGQYLDKFEAKTLPKDLSISISVDEDLLPRRMTFSLTDSEDGATGIQVDFTDFGRKLAVAPPAAAKIGKVELS
jgi:hypothetical protein